jgi:hypothetical protein
VETDQELELLRARVAHLESLVERLTGVRTVVRREPASPPPSGLDRRRMLRNGLGLSAAAVAGVGMLDAMGSSAAAADGDAVTIAQTKSPTNASSAPTRILNPSATTHSPALFQVDNATDTQIAMPGDTYAAVFATATGHDQTTAKRLTGVLGMSDLGIGVRGYSDGDTGVLGDSEFGVGVSGTSSTDAGVSGTSDQGPGVKATSTSGVAVLATSDSGYAVHGTSSSDDAAILGDSTNGFGVVGNAGNGAGVGGSGKTGVLAGGSTVGVDASCANGIAVKATSSAGTAVSAESGASSPAISATSTGNAPAVRATADSVNPGIAAVSTFGVGGLFQGATAAVRLVPRTTTGHPTTEAHKRGELVVDSAGALWICTKPGTPGKWKQLATV